MKSIYDTRDAILAEPLSQTSYRNAGIRLRRKLSRQQKVFEDRLASIVLDFSTKIDLDIGLVTEVAKDRI